MATKTIQASGGDYATPHLWVSYVAALGTLSAPEIGEMAAEEFNSGSLTLGGGSVVASATNQIILRCQTGAEYTGNPLKYVDGARILFDGTNEQMQVSWNHVVLQRFAISGTGANSNLGRLRVDYNLTVATQNLIIEESGSSATSQFDDRGAAASVRENCTLIRTAGSGSGTSALRSANFNKTYKNFTLIALNSPASSSGTVTAYATPIYINCVSYGYATDYGSTWNSGSSKNSATDKASGSSNIASMTGAQFSVVSGDFVSVTNGSHDIRVASGSTKLKDLGAASGGTTTDCLGNSISGGTRDIGAHEYQAGGGAPEIAVSGNSVTIADGDATPSATDHTDFGSVVQGGSALSRTFTVQNTGTADLTTSGLSVPSGYTVTEGLSATIAASASDTFTVELGTATVGVFAGDISFTNNDSDEGAFNFAVTGEITAPPPPPPTGIPFSPTFSPVQSITGLLIR